MEMNNWIAPTVKHEWNFAMQMLSQNFCRTQIAHKVRLHVRQIVLKNVIYKYKTSTLTPFVKPRDILNLTVQNVFYIQAYEESIFTYNPGSTKNFQRL